MQRAVSSCGHAEQPNGFRRHIQGRKGKRDTGVFQGLLPTYVYIPTPPQISSMEVPGLRLGVRRHVPLGLVPQALAREPGLRRPELRSLWCSLGLLGGTLL